MSDIHHCPCGRTPTFRCRAGWIDLNPVKFINLEEHGYARIERPEPGTWVMRVAGIVGYSDSPKLRDSGPNNIAYTAATSARSNLRVSVFTEDDPYQPRSPMKLAVAVSDLAPILGASVTALVSYHTHFVTWETLTHNVPGATWSGRLPGSPANAFLGLRVSAQAP